MAVSDETNEDLLKAMEVLQMPVVMLNRELAGEFDSVLIDDFNAARNATEYLIQLGHRRICLVTATEDIAPGRHRIAGFRKAFSEAGISLSDELIRHGSFEMDGYHEAFAVLDSREPPTAMIVGTQVLVGVLRALRQMQRRIPEDISLISCDDTYLAELSTPALTVMDRSLAECGRMAARLVLLRLNGMGSEKPQRIVLPTRLIRRSSCAPPAK
jgi:LacI family transcriptional regulator